MMLVAIRACHDDEIDAAIATPQVQEEYANSNIKIKMIINTLGNN